MRAVDARLGKWLGDTRTRDSASFLMGPALRVCTKKYQAFNGLTNNPLYLGEGGAINLAAHRDDVPLILRLTVKHKE